MTSMPPVARPFIKFVGGKTALLPEILPRLPAKIDTYYEPFIGGGAVFFALAAEGRFKRAVISDTNSELIRTYRALAVRPLDVIKLLKKHVYDVDHYYNVRAKNPSKLDDAQAAARFIYLNRTCFNGLYRVNKKGLFNVPFGKYTNPTICDEDGLLAVSRALRERSVDILDAPFEAGVALAKPGDAIYCDPPYWPASATANFTAYSAGGFGPLDQVRLRDAAKSLASRDIHVLLSNADVAPVRDLYASKGRDGTKFKIERVEAPRRVNSKGSKRGNVGELLITGVRR